MAAPKNATMLSREAAELFAARVLDWMAGQPDLMARFLGQSGLDTAQLPRMAGDPEFLASVLDMLLGDEAVLLACCEDLAEPPDLPMRARAALPGGDLPHWT
ncbi:MAG: DUF3572 domain-containing protein [Pseudomonadota bacterium]